MSEMNANDALTQTMATVGLLADLVSDATIRIEILRALFEKSGFSRSEFERVFQQARTDFSERLQYADSDLRMQAILKYIEGDGTKQQ